MRKKATIIIATLATLNLGTSPRVVAQPQSQVQFSQEIKLIDCTKTKVFDGASSFDDVRCDGAIMPTVNKLITSSPTPRISGTFDYKSMQEIKVLVDGQWYTYLSGLAMNQSGKWWLDIPDKSKLSVGVYDIIVEVATKEGLLLRDQTKDELIIEKDLSANTTKGDVCGTHKLLGLSWCWSPFVVGLITGVGVVVVYLSLVKRFRPRYNKK